MKKFILLLLVFFTFPFFAAAQNEDAVSDPDLLVRVLGEIKAASAGVETLASDFVQEKHLEMFQETLVSRGRFYFARPERLRWEMTEPVASGFVLQGDRGKRWHQRAGAATSFDIDSEPGMKLIAQQLLAWARVDLDWLGGQYMMTLEAEQPVALRLTPLAAGAEDYVDYLRIVFSGDRRHVDTVEIFEPGGDFTRIRFSGAVINGALSEDLF